MKLTVKGVAAVDPDSGLENSAHVLIQNDKIFSAMLGLVDIVRGTNSYYKLQLLEDDVQKRVPLSLFLSSLSLSSPFTTRLPLSLGYSLLSVYLSSSFSLCPFPFHLISPFSLSSASVSWLLSLFTFSLSPLCVGTGCSAPGAEWAPQLGAISWISSMRRILPWTTSLACMKRRQATPGVLPTSPSTPTNSTLWKSTTDR
uniref:NAD(+) ADP-ribosyltransferase n=1 Tax=Hucho hucho TaxID=62062 RepID=A0A4W5K5X8_9TELE